MPRLNKDQQEATDNAESSGGVMEEGFQPSRLAEVEVKEGDKGPYWKITFKNPEDSKLYPKRQHWTNISTSPAAAWKMKEFFEAFHASLDTDTDELIGKDVIVQVGTRTIQEGKRAGELANTVDALLPIDDEVVGVVTKSPANGVRKSTGRKANDLF